MNLERLYEARVCPVCGYKLDFTPWATAGPTEQVCPCCGIHFGYDDLIAEQRQSVYITWRQRWIKNGRRWWSKNPVPADFNPPWQLARLERFANEPPETPDSN
jgi:hypothetical protein